MTVSIPNDASITVLEANTTAIRGHAVWFQNFNTAAHIHLNVNGAATGTDFYLPRATSASVPSSLVIQASGGDTTLINKAWTAFQTSGGAINISCGRW
jgi:hypothetical protein